MTVGGSKEPLNSALAELARKVSGEFAGVVVVVMVVCAAVATPMSLRLNNLVPGIVAGAVAMAAIISWTLVALKRSPQRFSPEMIGSPEGRTASAAPETPPSSEVATSIMAALRAVTDTPTGKYSETQVRTYYVNSDGMDSVSLAYGTTVPTTETLAWRRVGIGAGAQDGRMASVHDVSLRLSPESRLTAIPVSEENNKFRYAIFFHPPLTGETLDWRLEYAWPNLWRELRTDGEDWAHFKPFQHSLWGRLAEVTIKSVEIRVVFPIGTTGQRIRRRTPLEGETSEAEIEGRPAVVWVIPKPRSIEYVFSVVAQLPRPPGRP